MLEVKNLEKSFKKIKAVSPLSFTVNEGEIVGLLGENGAGKTTTLRMIATMLKPTGGDAIVNGHSVLTHQKEVRNDIGILFGGDVALYDRLTGKENMLYFARLNGMGEADAEKAVQEIAEDLEMVEYMDRPVGKYSRGMKQKVSLARSIVHRPKLMLFDEPSTGLDVLSSRLIHDFILKCKRENKAIVFSSHSMHEVEKLCDRIIIIHKGEFIDTGTIAELKEKYQKETLEDVFISLIGGDTNA